MIARGCDLRIALDDEASALVCERHAAWIVYESAHHTRQSLYELDEFSLPVCRPDLREVRVHVVREHVDERMVAGIHFREVRLRRPDPFVNRRVAAAHAVFRKKVQRIAT